MDKIVMSNLDEVIYHETLENGLNIYVYKKKDFSKKGAYFVTNYGSSTNEFKPIGEDKITSFPKGIAHFLEHKLFESEDNEKVFEKFKKYGANVNAYTNHIMTNYYFSTVNNFYECLEELIDFVQKPYFTDQNVEKEKDIINQEINMSDDNINGYMFEEMFDLTLNKNPNKYKTIGDKENVSKITKEDLYRCYKTFYNPSNMILVAYGDIDEKKTISLIKDNQSKKKFDKVNEIEIKKYDEDAKVNKEYKETKRNVSKPRVSVCYKLKVPMLTGEERLKKLLFIELLLDMKFGSANPFEKNLIKEKIVETGISWTYSYFDDVILIFVQGDTTKKDMLIKKIDDKIKECKFDKELFELDRKVLKTNLVKTFENPSWVASMIYNNVIKNKKIINNVYDIYENYKFDYFLKEFKNINFDNKSILYVTKKEN
ncbi:MAG: EF-P 5-aminopentanol modification-associated protein YfmH [Candidatus Aphodocola sp.]